LLGSSSLVCCLALHPKGTGVLNFREVLSSPAHLRTVNQKRDNFVEGCWLV
jgi:hypothetical protein